MTPEARISHTPTQAAAQQMREAVSSIEREIRALIAAHLGTDEAAVTRDASLVGDLGADSLDAVALILAVEDEFQVDIPDEQAEQISTVRQLVEYATFAAAREHTAGASRPKRMRP